MAGAVEPRLGARTEAELGRRAATQDDEPRTFAATDVGGLVIGGEALKQVAARGCRFARLEDTKILDEKRHAGERSLRQPRSDRHAGRLVLPVHDGMDRRIDLLGACNRQLQHLPGGDVAPGYQPGKGGGVVLARRTS